MPVKFWNERYAADEYVYGKSPNLFFRDQIDAMKPGKLLTLAEGEGRNGVYAALKGWEVTAVDYSDEGQKKAMKLAREHDISLTYYLTPVEEFDFPEGHYDLVSLIYAHFQPDIRTLVHHKALKSLKKDGRLILEAFNKKQIDRDTGGPKNISMLYSLTELKKDFSDWYISYSEELTTNIDEGEFHRGEADIVRVVVEG